MTRHTGNGKATNRTPDKSADKPRHVREASEEQARLAAERLLSPAEPRPDDEEDEGVSPARTSMPEPSLEQRLADIDRRAKERATQEKRDLAAHYLTEARIAFRRAVSKTTDEAVKATYEEVQRLERLAGDNPAGAPAARSDASASDGDRPTRERRSPDSLKADAQKLFDWLKGHPNSKGSAATEATGVVVKPPLNVRTFIEKYLPGSKVKTEGQKAGTLYSIG